MKKIVMMMVMSACLSVSAFAAETKRAGEFTRNVAPRSIACGDLHLIKQLPSESGSSASPTGSFARGAR